jgi:AcrR family transcriptional regulator
MSIIISKKTSASGTFAERARSEGKSGRTRARLMDAAAAEFAIAGIEAASVNAIAHAADVSNGTFYNHFRDKDEITTAVAFGIARDFAERIDAAMTDLEDPAQRVAFGTRQFIELAHSEPTWGGALLRAVWSLPKLRKEVATFARADLERGVRAGVFRVEVDDLLLDLFISMVAIAVGRRISGEAGAEVGPRVAEHQLRMLGVSPARAHRAANRKLAPIELR